MVPVVTTISLVDVMRVPMFLTIFSPANETIKASSLFSTKSVGRSVFFEVNRNLSATKEILLLSSVLMMEKNDESPPAPVLSIPATRKRFP